MKINQHFVIFIFLATLHAAHFSIEKFSTEGKKLKE
jgi:hypothetical protein